MRTLLTFIVLLVSASLHGKVFDCQAQLKESIEACREIENEAKAMACTLDKLDVYVRCSDIKHVGHGWHALSDRAAYQIEKFGELSQGKAATSAFAAIQFECDPFLGWNRPLLIFETLHFEPFAILKGTVLISFDEADWMQVEGEIDIGHLGSFSVPHERIDWFVGRVRASDYVDVQVRQPTSLQEWRFDLAGSAAALDEIAGKCGN